MITLIKNDQKNSLKDQNQKNGEIGDIWIDGTGKHPKTRRT